MKKILLILAACLLIIPTLIYSQTPQPTPPPADTQDLTVWYPFNGKWMPDQDPTLIGPKNFKTLKNLRYTDTALEAVNGYTKINTSAVTTFPYLRNGIQLTTEHATRSYVIAYGLTSSGTSGVIYNTTSIPSQGNFVASGTTLFSDSDGADIGRFSLAPSGNMAYANTKENKIWAGSEMRLSAFFTCSGNTANLLTPIEYTDAVNDTAQTSGHYVSLGPLSGATNWLIFSTRPLDGVKYYVKSASVSGTTLVGYYWSGTTFTAVSNPSDGTKSGNTSFAQTGTYSFDSTVSTAKPYYFQGLYLYAYAFNLGAGSADIYHVTVSAPFQTIVDVWDGVFRQPVQFQFSYGNAYEDYTLEVNEASYPSVPIGAVLDGMRSTDNFIVMFDDRMAAIKFDMLAGFANTNASGVSIQYWNGTGYIGVENLSDETKSGTSTLVQTGVMSWTPPSGTSEFKQTLFGHTGYAYRFTVSATLSGTHGDATEELIVDQVTGIPAQNEVKPFSFPSIYKNRLFLAGYKEGNEGNRVDYSATNAPDVWNGEDSSKDGTTSLYFGGQEPLTAGTQLYNRLGSNIFAAWVGFKETETYILTGDTQEDFKIYPISYNIGCPAPLTVATAELGYEVAEEAQRNVVMWLSNTGPMMFDLAVFVPLRGVDSYFDPANSKCVNFEAIKNSRGWYDPVYKEYNLLIPSGVSQTTNNVWLVYDLQRKKWFSKDTGSASFPQSAWQVVDTSGKKYVYAGLDSGYMMRLENGAAWDSTAINQIVEVGDFYPSENIWDKTLIRRIKVVAKRINESHILSVTHFADTDDFFGVAVGFRDTEGVGWLDTSDVGWAGSDLISLELSLTGSAARVTRETEPVNLAAWAHRLHFEVSTDETVKGLQPLMWGVQYRILRLDSGVTN